jgi:hypothetical protein
MRKLLMEAPQNTWQRKQTLPEGKILFVMLPCMLVGTNYTPIVPFYPQLATDVGLGPAVIGCIFAAMPIGILVTSAYLSSHPTVIGKVDALILSSLFTALSSFAIAASLETAQVLFTLIGLSARFSSGVALALSDIASFSLLNSDYELAMLERAIGAVEVVSSLGYIFGALLLSALCSVSDPQIAFILYGLIMTLSTLPTFCIRTADQVEEEQKQAISLLDLLRHTPLIAIIGSYIF